MGSEAEKLFTSFNLSEDEKKSYEAVLKKFDEYFIPRRNIIHERACFYQRGQQPGETAEQYIRVLYEVAEHREFGDKRDEHIRDRLVVGIQDKELSRKFQLKEDLTLQEVTEQIRQAEEINKHVSLQSSAPEAMAVNMVRRQSGPHTDRPGRYRPRQDASSRQGTYKMEGCGKCDVTVVNQSTYKMMKPKIELQLPNTRFVSPGGDLKCMGLFQATTKYKEQQYTFNVYVIEGKVSCLLGRHEAVEMGLVIRVNEVSTVFSSGGLLDTEPVKIVLQEGAQPYAVHTARRIPLPLVPLVKKELHRMESEGIIEKDNLKPGWPDMDKIQQADASAKQKQAHFYNRRHGVRCLPPLSPGDPVLTKLDGQKQWTRPAVIQGTSSTPRSYIVETAQGERYRRNRRHLLAVPHRATPENVDPVANSQTVDSEMTNKEPAVITPETVTSGSGMTRSGRVSRPAAKLDL
uniref:Retrotransposon gag domain-containing protein n=1 Tax=Knipowitschia caucasica TaxID=637954 RepID=A0AAV2LJT0_KNICA